jgi:hypothetical protein
VQGSIVNDRILAAGSALSPNRLYDPKGERGGNEAKVRCAKIARSLQLSNSPRWSGFENLPRLPNFPQKIAATGSGCSGKSAWKK